MKNISTILVLSLLCISSFAQKKIKLKSIILPTLELYQAGKYKSALKELEKLENNKLIIGNQKVKGLIEYWRALSNFRLNEYDDGIAAIKKAINLQFKADDIHYEYGQALYVSEKLKEARLAFRQSVKSKYKVGVSLYYIAYISQQLKDLKKAVGFYNMIEKLPKLDQEGVLQASRMQVADIYLAQVEKLPNSFSSIEKYVLPQYKKAFNTDPESKLALEIQNKIKEIQRRYDLLVFKMRNGRPTSFPRYFIRANMGYSLDDNIRRLSESSKQGLSEEDYASSYLNAGLYTRYTFYPNAYFSISPEVTIDYTKYSSDSNEIKPFNNLGITGGLQINYEHSYNKAPATTYINIDYNYLSDDANADDTLEEASNTTSITISEELQFWLTNPSTFRYRFSSVAAIDETDSNTSHSFIWEQLVNISNFSLFLFNSFDLTNYSNAQTNNTSAVTSRVDFILPSFYNLFNPNIFLSINRTNYTDDDSRGATSLLSYGVTLSRPVGNKLFLNMNYSIDSQSGDLDSDNFDKSLIGLNLEYYY